MSLRRWSAWVSGIVVVSAGLGASNATAQDTRNVTEPKIPPSCVQLQARLQAFESKVSEADEGKLDTERIQAAIDGCKPGMSVELRPASGKNAFLTGPLEMRTGVTLLVDEGVTLFGSRDPKVYEIKLPDAKPGDPVRCGTSTPRPASFPVVTGATQRRGGCRPLIGVNNATGVGVMGDGVIDGRGYAKLLGKDYSWWEMARRAEPKDDIYYSTRLIVANHADGLTLYRITLHNSPNFHVSVNGTDGFTAWGVHLLTPTDKTLDARNTDGIDPGTSKNVTVAQSWIDNGDDNIAIKQGTTHMSVIGNHFYTGHGMSIGSETVLGQSYLLVDGLTEDHTTSGIRVKSNVKRGGPVHDLVYQNICMRNVKNPIAISPYYTNQTTEPYEDPKYEGDKIPDYKRITIRNVVSTTPGEILLAGLNDEHRTGVTLDGVTIAGIKPAQVHGHFADVTLGPGGTNIDFSGTDLKTTGATDGNNGPGVEGCAGKFVPMH